MDRVKYELDFTISYANPGDHVPEIERNNRTVKERYCTQYQRLPFQTIPKFMIRYLASEVVIKLVFFRSKDVCHHIIAP